MGDTAIFDSTTIRTQRGDGVTHVQVHSVTPTHPPVSGCAFLSTITGAGRTNIFYIAGRTSHRPVHNNHLSSMNGELYLVYREAKDNGFANLEAEAFEIAGVLAEDKEGQSGRTGWEIRTEETVRLSKSEAGLGRIFDLLARVVVC